MGMITIKCEICKEDLEVMENEHYRKEDVHFHKDCFPGSELERYLKANNDVKIIKNEL